MTAFATGSMTTTRIPRATWTPPPRAVEADESERRGPSEGTEETAHDGARKEEEGDSDDGDDDHDSMGDALPPPPIPDALDAGRMHSTVRLNQFTLQFEDATLEAAYQAATHRRKKALWLRSLIPAAAFHILFGLSDVLEHPAEYLLVTIPARVFLSVLQVSMFVLVQWDLVRASESTMLLVSICNGIPTLLLYALQRPSLHQWDALFVVFGLSFYTIPKITPLGFVASTLGSWATAALYAVLSFLIRPPTRTLESLLGFAYCAPVVGIFNTISYYSEYNSRERFVLRRRLRSESITLAVSRTNRLPMVTTGNEGLGFSVASVLNANGSKFFMAVALWAALTIGSWVSLPEMLKFVDEETGWAWFSHCAGLTVFLLITTRQLVWLFVVPVLGSFVLWMMAMTMPAYWIIISAHSVGYGLLLASIVVAMGVFSRFVLAWRELVSFLTRSCFLYPQLQEGLQNEYPLLVKIVSEYTAGMDPEIIMSRDTTNRAIGATTNSMRPVEMSSRDNGQLERSPAPFSPRNSGPSPRRRVTVSSSKGGSRRVLDLASSVVFIDSYSRSCVQDHQTTDAVHASENAGAGNKMISVLPSFKAGKCFFCSKNEAEHLVPACGMWGKWTHWRMSQQQDILFGSLALPGSASSKSVGSHGGSVVGKHVAAMCTSYYDVQHDKALLEQELGRLETSIERANADLMASQEREAAAVAVNVHQQAEIRAMKERHAQDLHAHQALLQSKMDKILEESNHTAHEQKRQLRDARMQNKELSHDLQNARTSYDKLTEELTSLKKLLKEQEFSLKQSNAAFAELHAELELLRKANTKNPEFKSSADAHSPTENAIRALQPSRRMPYARWLEIEGMRESITKKDASDHSWALP